MNTPTNIIAEIYRYFDFDFKSKFPLNVPFTRNHFQSRAQSPSSRSAVRDGLWETGIDQINSRSISGQKLGLPVFIAHALRSKRK